MGVMKRNLLLVLAVCTAFCLQANASIPLDQMTEPEYLINNGYSEAMAEEVTVSKNRVAGNPVEPLYDKKHNKFVRFLRNMYGYIDPGIDTDDRLYHDIKLSPSYKDY